MGKVLDGIRVLDSRRTKRAHRGSDPHDDVGPARGGLVVLRAPSNLYRGRPLGPNDYVYIHCVTVEMWKAMVEAWTGDAHEARGDGDPRPRSPAIRFASRRRRRR